jgi:hypothetical protein
MYKSIEPTVVIREEPENIKEILACAELKKTQALLDKANEEIAKHKKDIDFLKDLLLKTKKNISDIEQDPVGLILPSAKHGEEMSDKLYPFIVEQTRRCVPWPWISGKHWYPLFTFQGCWPSSKYRPHDQRNMIKFVCTKLARFFKDTENEMFQLKRTVDIMSYFLGIESLYSSECKRYYELYHRKMEAAKLAQLTIQDTIDEHLQKEREKAQNPDAKVETPNSSDNPLDEAKKKIIKLLKPQEKEVEINIPLNNNQSVAYIGPNHNLYNPLSSFIKCDDSSDSNKSESENSQ